MDRLLVLLRDGNRLVGRLCFQNFISAGSKQIARQAAQRLFVLDQQNGLRSSPGWRGLGSRLLRASWFVDYRQIDLEGGALARLAIHPDVPSALPHDAVNHGEAQAGAVADLFGGEEGLENARLSLRVDTDAGVRDGQQHI